MIRCAQGVMTRRTRALSYAASPPVASTMSPSGKLTIAMGPVGQNGATYASFPTVVIAAHPSKTLVSE